MFENDYFQFTQGLMPEDVWQAKLEALAFSYNQCNYRDLMDRRKSFFSRGSYKSYRLTRRQLRGVKYEKS